MHRRSTLFCLALSAAALFISELIGIYLSNTYGEYDIFFTPAHFLGGVTAGLGVLYVAQLFSYRISLTTTLLLVLAVGLGWEAYEYIGKFGITKFDTAADIVADLLGGLLAYRLVAQKK